MKIYEKPLFAIFNIETSDCIRTSAEKESYEENELPLVPFGKE